MAPRPAPLLCLLCLLASASLLLASPLALADRRAPKAEPPPGWQASSPQASADVRAGKPFVSLVVVPLCSSALIDCGSSIAGKPADLAHNIYWGAVFGQRTFFTRPRSGWSHVELGAPGGPVLERLVVRRKAPGARWGVEGDIEQLVVFEAFHGDRHDEAIARFFSLARGGGLVSFRDGERTREARIHVAGYAGHNRLMDGTSPPAGEAAEGEAPVPSFVIACKSEPYFSARLRATGSSPLVMTRQLMAPEGYAVDGVLRALGDGASAGEARARAVAAYARWQRITEAEAGSIFAR